MLPNGFPPAGDGRRRSSAPPSKELTSRSPVAIPYSWGHLVVPYTEELISRPFLDENSIWRLFWDRVDPWPAAGCFYSRPLSLLYWISLNCQVPWGWHCIFRWICLQNAKMDLSRAIFFYFLHLPPHPQLFRFEDQSNILICLTTTRSCFINLKWFFLLTFWNFI